MSPSFRCTCTAAATLALSTSAFAEAAPPSASPAQPHRISLSTNPLPFLLSGYAIGLGYIAPALPRVRFYATHHAIGGLPAFLNRNPDWNTLIRAYTLNGQYFWQDGGRGWFTGGQLALTTNLHSRNDTPGETATTATLDFGVAGGYRWFPFAVQGLRGLFLMPWLRAGVSAPVTEPAAIGDFPAPAARSWNVTPLVSLGYELDL